MPFYFLISSTRFSIRTSVFAFSFRGFNSTIPSFGDFLSPISIQIGQPIKSTSLNIHPARSSGRRIKLLYLRFVTRYKFLQPLREYPFLYLEH